MKVCKKAVSLFLVLVLILGLAVVPASAADSDFNIDSSGRLVKYLGSGGDVVIPNSVKVIGYSAFSGCTGLTSVTIPNSVTEITSNAFYQCTGLTHVTIPSSVTKIQSDTFAYCTGLASVTIPDSVTEIDDAAFYGCTALTSVAVPDGVTRIGRMAFYGCTKLASVTLPAGFTQFGACAFYNTAWQKSLGDFAVVNGVLLAYQGKGASVTIPDTVTTIAGEVLYNNTRVTSVVIPDSVTAINTEAFYKRTSLTSVTIGAGGATIGDNAFKGCSKLTSVTFTGPVGSISSSAFLDTPWRNSAGNGDFLMANSTLVSYQGSGGDVVIPDNVTVIGSNAFYNCTNLTSVTIPSSVTAIGDYAFHNCDGLTSVTIPNGVVSIGNSAFSYCSKLARVAIPNSVTTIGSQAFRSCVALTDVAIPNSVTAIGGDAFRYCTSLTSIAIPASVTALGGGVFEGCTSLTSADLAHSMTEISNGLFADCTALRNVSIPDGVTTIDSKAFYNCHALTGITIPDGVTKIGDFAFYGCGLTGIVIPNSVTAIGSCAFYGCSKLSSLSIPDSGIELGQQVFTSTNLGHAAWTVIYRLQREQWINLAACVKPQSERVTKLSDQITAGLTSDYEKAEAICSWVSKNIKYDYGYYYEQNKDWSDVTIEPEEVLDSRLTVCVGYSQLTQALLQAQGIPALYVTGMANGAKGWEGHAWNEIFADGRWILADTTWGTKYFDMELSAFTQKHHIGSRMTSSAEDIPTSWARTEVWEAMTTGLLPGDLQSAYRGAITREEFCRLMIALVEQTTGQEINSYAASRGLAITDPFVDTDTPEVLAAYALGIVSGTSATTFTPTGSITRQDAATMLARTAKVLGLTATDAGETFVDAESFSSYAREGIAFVSGLTDPVVGSKVMNGTGNGYFSPKSTYTREQAYMTALRLFHCAASI